MKRYIIRLIPILSLLIFLSACEKERILFSEEAVVGFAVSAVSVSEASQTGVTIPIYLGAEAGAPGTEVTLEVITEGHANPAYLGEAFTISSQQVSLDIGTTLITIMPIDDDVFTGNRTFTLKIASNSKDYPIAAQNAVIVTIIDDEHPLARWLGSYVVGAVSYDAPGTYDETWNVTTSPVDGNVNQIKMLGVAGSAVPVIATIDMEAKTISVASGQNIGVVYGANFGQVAVYYGGDMKDIIWGPAPGPILEAAASTLIVGTIEDNGTIKIDNWAHILVQANNWIFDVFNTTWTKQ